MSKFLLNRAGFRGAALLLALAGATSFGGLAVAQSTIDAAAACSQDADPAMAVAGCTSLLEKGALSTEMQASVLNMRGVAHQNAGDIGRALRDFAEASKRDPKQIGAIAGLAIVVDDLNRRCLRETGDSTIVESCALLIDNAGPADVSPAVLARAYAARGAALVRQGRAADARADFSKALERKGDLDAAIVREAERVLTEQRAPEPSAAIALSRPAGAAEAATEPSAAEPAANTTPRAALARLAGPEPKEAPPSAAVKPRAHATAEVAEASPHVAAGQTSLPGRAKVFKLAGRPTRTALARSRTACR